MTSGGKKKRVRKWTSEERAAHRIFEKSRREAFNDSMIDLARQIPSLTGTRRLNKHMIVEHSVARHRAQRQLAMSVLEEMQALITERDELLAEVNQWRTASNGLPMREARSPGKHMQQLLQMRSEVFGAFTNGFGDNAPEEGSGDEQTNDDAKALNGIHTRPSPALITPLQNVSLHHDYVSTSLGEILHHADQPNLMPLEMPHGVPERSTALGDNAQMDSHTHTAYDSIDYANYPFLHFASENFSSEPEFPPFTAPPLPSQSWSDSHQYPPGIASMHHQDGQPILDHS